MRDQNTKSTAAPIPEPTGIVSVNDRGGASTGMTGKVAFVLLVVGLAIIGGLIGFNKYRAAKKADEASIQLAAGMQSQPTDAGKRRTFNTDPPPLPGAAAAKTTPSAAANTASVCTDYTSSQPLLGPDGNPMTSSSGQPIRVCKNGQIIVPAVVPMTGEPGHPIAVIPNSATRSSPVSSAAPTSRYGGDVLLPAWGNAATASAIDPNNPYIRALLNTSLNAPASAEPTPAESEIDSSSQSGANVSSGHHGAAASRQEGSDAKRITATMIGDRDMILPEGRSIDCNLSVRLVNEVSGKATCVLSSNVYSDNGRVVLAERGSTATGEYVAITAGTCQSIWNTCVKLLRV